MTSQQLGFGFEEMAEEQRTAYLPSTIEEAIPLYRAMIERHHAAMLAGDEKTAMAIRQEAHDLAVKVNGGDAGICAEPDSPAYVLERATAAPAGTVPLWGQTGGFTISVGAMQVRIEQEGIFGIGAGFGVWPGFSAHVVDPDKPFLSETGYRSFLGCHAEMVPGITPDRFVKEMIEAYLKKECKGKLRSMEKSYVERIKERRSGAGQQRS